MQSESISIKGVTIGDKFHPGATKKMTAQVVDIREVRSMMTGEIVDYICIARADGLAHNEYPVPFSTVVRNRIQ